MDFIMSSRQIENNSESKNWTKNQTFCETRNRKTDVVYVNIIVTIPIQIEKQKKSVMCEQSIFENLWFFEDEIRT